MSSHHAVSGTCLTRFPISPPLRGFRSVNTVKFWFAHWEKSLMKRAKVTYQQLERRLKKAGHLLDQNED